MLRSLISKQQNIALRIANKQKACLSTWTRQVRGAQPSLIEADLDFAQTSSFKQRLYTVRPVNFWMDKILENETKEALQPTTNEYKDVFVKKTMSDSYVEEYLPFKSSPTLLDEYITTGGKIRMSKILEDLDALAGSISYKHMDTFVDSPPLTVVTASLDRMEVLMPNTIEDLKLSGHVAHVGKSSMEIFLKLETVPEYDPSAVEASAFPPKDFIAKPTPNTILFSRITMVAVDSVTGKAAQVNPLITRNEEEKKISEYAQDCKSHKKQIGENALSKVAPTTEERLTLHDLYMKHADQKEIDTEKAVWMEDMNLQSVLLMQPQNRNIHNKVFGGYLMGRAFELAQATGSVFAKSNVKLLSLDEIIFKKPVSVGSLLKLSSQVIYSPGEKHKSFQVSVTASVTDVETGTTDVTNNFHFSFASQDKPVRKILPRTYAESMLYIDGKRRRQNGIQAKKQLLSLMNNNNQ